MNEEDFQEIEQKIIELEAAEVGMIDTANLVAIFHRTLTNSGINSTEATMLTGFYITAVLGSPKK